MKIYLIAQKLSHSFSPFIHGKLADYDYQLKELNIDELDAFFKKRDFDGLNVTVPYKVEVMKYLDYVSPEAQDLGAVNTIVNRDGKLCGYNTDYYGFCYMAQNAELCGKDVVIIGSGGASKAVVAACEKLGARRTRILPHEENKKGSVEKFYDCDVLINTTPVGMYPKTGVSPVDLECFEKWESVLDVIYNPSKTKLLLDAERLGKKGVNGLSMLVAQAKKACEIFTGESVPDEKISAIQRLLEDETTNIILVGMPGAGKTTIGKITAEKMGREFVDTDEVISQRYGMPKDIIKTQGEATFRKIEADVFSEFSKKSSLVISTGGGIVTIPENLEKCRQNGYCVFIERKIELLETKGRPLSQGDGAIQKLYEVREPLYKAFAEGIVKNDDTPEKVADIVINKFKDR